MQKKEIQILAHQIFAISSEKEFGDCCRIIYDLQHENLTVFRDYKKLIHKNRPSNQSGSDFVFLPVDFFKTYRLIAKDQEAQAIFRSSGTSGIAQSLHYVADEGIYRKCVRNIFNMFYEDDTQYCFLALLPSYQERNDSSLVYMMNLLMKNSSHQLNGFYMNNHEDLFHTLTLLKNQKQKTWLIGTPFSLLEFTDNYSLEFPQLTVVETGGMKGRRKEIVREELYAILIKKFGVDSIHSEYGMTELLSQAYSVSGGKYKCPPWMKIVIHEITDPLEEAPTGKAGIISVIDLANIYSCSFIQTQDIGKKNQDGTFEVLGRLDLSDVRGCSLMTA